MYSLGNVKQSKRGFTLIELLVVVLIIGILAAIALPQYNKAVRKARLAEVATTFRTLSTAIDAWVLENGYPAEGSATFFGDEPTDSLDITVPFQSQDRNKGNNKVGGWGVECLSTLTCHIIFASTWNADGTTGNNWLDGIVIYWLKENDGPWELVSVDSADATPEVCRWWKELFGSASITDSAATTCADYL